ncbi:hypothetical protein HMPREF9098_0597 [Kingella denitrificans ATCC 33394]|uniref:Uncharacterized protein n=1 Tax=Kingella denitrificans ATCC 33394 TaxID=888741 RepID=F0EXL3_9NEIS|nr:hypothetical protein HMPREF9098_0597 [Kingella denitrificans ATCC 33394]
MGICPLFGGAADKVIQRRLATWVALRAQFHQLCQKGGLFFCGERVPVFGGNAVVERCALAVQAAVAEIAAFVAGRIAHGQFHAAAVQKNIVGHDGDGQIDDIHGVFLVGQGAGGQDRGK